MKKKEVLPANVVPIEYARYQIEVEVHCSICDKNLVSWLRFNQSIDQLRCPLCINPVELLYPPKWKD